MVYEFDNEKKTLFIQAFQKSFGNISKACEKIGVSRQTYYDWRNDDPMFLEAVKNVKDGAVDMAETALLKQITEGNTTAIIFYLKTQAKDRGYGDQIQVEHSGGVAIEQRPTRAIVEIIGND